MRCPFCREDDSRVVDSRTVDDGAAIRRRRECAACGRRFTTAETASMLIAKRSGVLEPFSRAKVVSGVRKACQGRPVSDDDLALLLSGEYRRNIAVGVRKAVEIHFARRLTGE